MRAEKEHEVKYPDDDRVIDAITSFRGPDDGEPLLDYLEAVAVHAVQACPGLSEDQFMWCFDAVWHSVLRPTEAPS